MLGLLFAVSIPSGLPIGGQVGSPRLATADPPKFDADQLRARFIAQFPTYLEWPKESLPERTTPLVIVTVDAPTLATELRTIFERLRARAEEARKKNPERPLPRPVQVRSHSARAIIEKPELLAGAHVVHLGKSVVGTPARKILGMVSSAPTLTISDRVADHPRATMIELVPAKAKFRIAIRRHLLKKAGLRASSKLLRLAELLPDPEEQEGER